MLVPHGRGMLMHAFLNAPNQMTLIQRCHKIAWPSRRDAMKVRGKHRKPDGLAPSGTGTMQVYRCRQCHGWHLGHANNGPGYGHVNEGPERDDL